jgi:hypothetical protein
MKRAFAVCTFLLATIFSWPAFPWDAEGHEVTGSVADQLLTANAKAKVQAILGFELRVAAPWLDCVRSVAKQPHGSFKYAPNPNHPEYRVPCTSFEQGDELARMEDYVRRNYSNCDYSPDRRDHCHEAFHFVDVDIQHNHYDWNYVGTSDHDAVSTINAAIAILKGKPALLPFSIKDNKEALFLLAHLVGDLHQPVHVGSVYLDPNGALVRPDGPGGLDRRTETHGGNSILEAHGNLHGDWDSIPQELGKSADGTMVNLARSVASTPGPVESWAATWATDTIVTARTAFAGMTFTSAPDNKWQVHFDSEPDYRRTQTTLKVMQLAKGGARLAELLNALFP